MMFASLHGWLTAVLFGALALGGVIASSMPAQGAGASISITANMVSATQIDVSACGPATVSFGALQTGTSIVTNADCTIGFGSTNDSSMLHMYQSDRSGSAMFRMTDGTLDANWDGGVAGNGQFTIPGATSLGQAAVALQPSSGKVVAAYQRTGSDINVVRFNEDGTLDGTFGTAGRYSSVGTVTDGSWGSVPTITVASDGSILIAGLITNAGLHAREWMIMKLTPNGVLDATFDGTSGTGDGIAYLTIDPAGSELNGMRILSSGKLLLWGTRAPGAVNRGVVVRTDAQGRFDTSFAGTGRMELDLGWHTLIEQAVEQPDGMVVLAGWEWAGDPDFVLARVRVDGTLDPAWDGPGTGGGSNGLFWVPGMAGAWDSAESLAVLPDGDILAVGSSDGQGDDDVYSMRFNASDGSFDTAWDGPTGTGNGKVQLRLTTGPDIARSVLVSPGGEIFVAGTMSPGGAGLEPVLMKWRSDGTLDPAFDGDSGTANGAVRVAATVGDDDVHTLALGRDGDLLVAGTTDAGTDLLRMTRFKGTPFTDYDDDDLAADNNWTEGTGFFGACLRSFTGTSAVSSWTTNATCSQSDASDYWRPVPTNAGAKLGQISSGVGSASLRFGARIPATTTPGIYTAPVTFEVIAPAV